MWFAVNGYRRFEAKCDVRLDDHVVAITGPNEAGKSSLLDALGHLNSDDPFSHGELTRRTEIPSDQDIIRAHFLLEPNDLAAVAHLKQGSDIRWLIIAKRQNGALRCEVTPELHRDLESREKARIALERLRSRIEKKPPKDDESGDTEEPQLDIDIVDEVIDDLSGTEERLSRDTLDEVAELGKALLREAESYGQTGKRALRSSNTMSFRVFANR